MYGAYRHTPTSSSNQDAKHLDSVYGRDDPVLQARFKADAPRIVQRDAQSESPREVEDREPASKRAILLLGAGGSTTTSSLFSRPPPGPTNPAAFVPNVTTSLFAKPPSQNTTRTSSSSLFAAPPIRSGTTSSLFANPNTSRPSSCELENGEDLEMGRPERFDGRAPKLNMAHDHTNFSLLRVHRESALFGKLESLLSWYRYGHAPHQQSSTTIPNTFGAAPNEISMPVADVLGRERRQLRRAWLIENPLLWKRYVTRKGEMREELRRLRDEFGKTIGMGSAHVERDLPGALDRGLNETWLLHGTQAHIKKSTKQLVSCTNTLVGFFKRRSICSWGWSSASSKNNVKSILENGLLRSKARGGCFGSAIYLAENAAKSVHYAVGNGSGEAFLLVCRVLVGYYQTVSSFDAAAGGQQMKDAVEVAGHTKPATMYAYHRSAAESASSLVQTASSSTRQLSGIQYHSRVCDAGSSGGAFIGASHREFCIENEANIYPEYLLCFSTDGY
ncbi:unnamed protein product [Amoebophrya sp. A25]|nr:unnamed protein product [Amoebophrya sp. A25]|eukprot:GSA25T00015631001.1